MTSIYNEREAARLHLVSNSPWLIRRLVMTRVAHVGLVLSSETLLLLRLLLGHSCITSLNIHIAATVHTMHSNRLIDTQGVWVLNPVLLLHVDVHRWVQLIWTPWHVWGVRHLWRRWGSCAIEVCWIIHGALRIRHYLAKIHRNKFVSTTKLQHEKNKRWKWVV